MNARVLFEGQITKRSISDIVTKKEENVMDLSGLGRWQYFGKSDTSSAMFEGYMVQGHGFGRFVDNESYYIGNIKSYSVREGYGTLITNSTI